jgi:hypothetical protein
MKISHAGRRATADDRTPLAVQPLSWKESHALQLRSLRPENVQIYCLRQRAHRAEYGGKALDHGGAWYRNLSLFEGDDRKGCKGFEQLAGAKQEIGIARPAEAFVAAREGLVDQHSTRREGAGNRREQWAVQVIGNDDSIIVIAELPTVGLEVDPAHLTTGPRERQQCRGITVDRAHGKSAVAQQANMPATAGREIEHKTPWLDQRQKAVDPDGGGRRGLRRSHADGDGFEAQQRAGEISCPECGETKVEKAVMAPRLGKPLRRFRRLTLGLGVAEDPGGGPKFRPTLLSYGRCGTHGCPS